MNEFSNLSVEDLKTTSKREKAITPLLNEFEIDYGTNASVNNVYFCPFERSANLLIYQSSEVVGKLSVFSVDFTNNQFRSEFLEDIVVGSQVNNIAWSPQTKGRYFFPILTFNILCNIFCFGIRSLSNSSLF